MVDCFAERLQRGGLMSTERRIHRDEAAWREIFARQEASGLRRSQFCRQEGINPGVFRRWREKLNGEAQGPTRRSRAGSEVTEPFIDMGALETARLRLEVRLELAPGVVLSIARS